MKPKKQITHHRINLVAPPFCLCSFVERKTSPPLFSLFLFLFLSRPFLHQPKNSATIAWREEYKPDEITFDDIKALNTGRLELSKDRDVDGRPLVFFRLR